MTDEDRETLDTALTHLLVELTFLLPKGTDVREHPIAEKLLECKRAWITAALSERTCGTCHHGERLQMRPGHAQRLWCHIHSQQRDPHDGCVKGYAPREGCDGVPL